MVGLHLAVGMAAATTFALLSVAVRGEGIGHEVVQEFASFVASVLAGCCVLYLVWWIDLEKKIRWATTVGTLILVTRIGLILYDDLRHVRALAWLPEGGSLATGFQTVSSEVGLVLLLSGFMFSLLEISQKNQRLAAEARKREELLHRNHQVNKLESLGILAGGIAHDFNNLLARIAGNVSLALEDLPFNSPVRDNLNAIESAVSAGARLSRQMLAYSGRGSFVLEEVHLDQLATGVPQLLRAWIPENVSLEVRAGASVSPIEGDAKQICQIVINLATNAIESFEGHQGSILVQVGMMSLDERLSSLEYTFGAPPDAPCPYLEVTDNGPGMRPDTLERLFDPFFSTKGPGRGLGMAVVLGIVRGHRGVIRLDSVPGKGTTVRVFFPPLDGARERWPRPSAESEFTSFPHDSGASKPSALVRAA
ncbi:MAG: hypothetical protein HUU16_01325 [Candidatus Omnitrophica bacterium]|nr:hypothetical protein [bacterium]NUN94788.1 hypothetical protein [Candidatus Omnitrophota bacterium]